MPTPSTPLTEPHRPIAAVCRAGARAVLDSWLGRRLSAASVHLLLDLAGRPDHAPVASHEAIWLGAAVALLLEARHAGAAVAEAAQGREVPA